MGTEGSYAGRASGARGCRGAPGSDEGGPRSRLERLAREDGSLGQANEGEGEALEPVQTSRGVAKAVAEPGGAPGGDLIATPRSAAS